MRHSLARPALLPALVFACALPFAPAPAPAQTAGQATGQGVALPVFDSAEAMREELDRLMRGRDFVAVVERFAPPDTRSVGRVRILEDRLKASLGPLEDSAHMIRDQLAPGMLREVIAYWAGDSYAYVYLLTHARDDGIRVLDFRITGDVRAIGDWW